jgi:hypothetical protein
MTPNPVFILAPPRSFTSVICGMIGQHPEMYALPEVNLFAADDYEGLGRVYRLRPGFRHGLLRSIAELGLGGQTEENIDVARNWLEEYDKVSTAEIYNDLVDWANPRRLVDKSPIYVYSEETLQRIKNAFPDASYIHLVRHPRGTCESIFKLRGVVQDGLDKMQLGKKIRNKAMNRDNKLAKVSDPDSLWLKPHLRIIEFLDEISDDRKRQIKGEDFMTDPDTFLPELAGWLGISTAKDAIESMKHPERSPFACLGPANAKFGNDPSFLQEPELREYKAREYSLEGPLEGSPETEFSEDLMQCAMFFGYK